MKIRHGLLALPLFALAGCPIDERDMGVRAGAGSAGSAGADSLPEAGDGGEAGGGDAGMGGAGTGNTAGRGGRGGGAGKAGAGGSGGSAGSGGTGTAGDGGDGGEPGGCGDLDHNGVTDCDETVAQNPTFDVDDASWSVEPTLDQEWDPRDGGGETGSGALSVVNQTVGTISGNTIGGSRQCLPAWGLVTYSIASRVFIPTGQGGGKGGISVAFYGSTDCGDHFLSSGGPPLASETGAWISVAGESKAPPAARSMFVRLLASKPFSEPPLEVLFDNILVREE